MQSENPCCAVIVIAYDRLDSASRRNLLYTEARIYKEGVLAGSEVGGRESAYAYIFPMEEADLINDGFAHILPDVKVFLETGDDHDPRVLVDTSDL